MNEPIDPQTGQLPQAPSVSLPSAWQSSVQGTENRKRAQQNLRLRHGMFTGIPIICQGQKCPYYQTCWIPDQDLQVGERCPIEIAAILERFDRYCEQLRIDPDEDIVDAGLVKEVVDIEVMMLRADNLMAIDGKFIEDVVAGVSPKGKEYTRPELHVAVEFKEKLRKEKTRILNQLNATRKDKKNDGLLSQDPSSVAARIIAKVKNFEKQGIIIDVEQPDIIEMEEAPPTIDTEQKEVE